MAVYTSGQTVGLQDKLVINTDCDNSSKNDVFGGSVTMYAIRAKNPSATVCYLKLYNTAAPTVGTTAPDIIIECPGQAEVTWVMQAGVTFNVVSMSAVQEDGHEGTTNPAENLDVRIVAK